ncbi:hypothetical protein [Planctobacterium marinum]|uniref:Uncharacterized protein n=1 Tax=Planctobacterium marinum TaxID=1631968 RepID=A0AA48KRW8_9ALTE|nr:hypothetical protein MACH26_35340 [Planctobacterium marinum]
MAGGGGNLLADAGGDTAGREGDTAAGEGLDASAAVDCLFAAITDSAEGGDITAVLLLRVATSGCCSLELAICGGAAGGGFYGQKSS